MSSRRTPKAAILRGWLTGRLDVAVQLADDSVTILRKRALTGGMLLCAPFLFGIAVPYLMYGAASAGVAYACFGAWLWLQLWLFVRWHRRVTLAFWSVAVPALLTQSAVAISLGDVVHSGAIALWGLAFPVATGAIFVPARQVLPLSALYLGNVIIGVAVAPSDAGAMPEFAEQMILGANLVGLSAFAAILVGWFVSQRKAAIRLLGEEQRKVRALLLSILPEEVADELANQRGVIAKHYSEASVLFADVVGFTPMAERMAPAELVATLDELFACFDDLVALVGAEKIKTVGDGYVVAAGVLRTSSDHATALASLALQMQQAMQTRTFCGRRLEVRIGLDSGPVVAGVIGRQRPSYDLWGDVVNTASACSRTGLPERCRSPPPPMSWCATPSAASTE